MWRWARPVERLLALSAIGLSGCGLHSFRPYDYSAVSLQKTTDDIVSEPEEEINPFLETSSPAETINLRPSVLPSIEDPVPLPKETVPPAPKKDVKEKPVTVPFADERPLGSIMLAQVPRLTEATVVNVVLQRNPTLEQMRAAALAATAKAPQVSSLDDPLVGVTTAPASSWSKNTKYAARVEVSQKIPLGGKRELRGQMADAEANAVARDIDDAQLQLIEATRTALADYYQAERSLDVTRENRRLLDEFRKNAETRYKTGLVPQQDILQADVEIGRQEERVITLTRALKVAQARLNTLMHLPPDSPLLAAPESVRPQDSLPDVKELRKRALANRPEVKALADRIASEEAAVGLAKSEYHPDVEVLAAYDSFWQGREGRPLQWQIGARVNVPIRTGRREAAITEAQARVVQKRAELSRFIDRINYETQEAYEQMVERMKIVALYEKSLLPTAAANVKEAEASYVNGKVAFLNLIEAQRNLTDIRDKYYEALAETARRRAALERATGTPRDVAN
jgi:cobalt-zinc-cadmium efflux system outer membrane protein